MGVGGRGRIAEQSRADFTHHVTAYRAARLECDVNPTSPLLRQLRMIAHFYCSLMAE